MSDLPSQTLTDLKLTPTRDWREYRKGLLDREGEKIDSIYAITDKFVIYFRGCELFYQVSDDELEPYGAAEVLLAEINRMLPTVSEAWDPRHDWKKSTLELVADALEMVLCGSTVEGIGILTGIRDKLKTTAESSLRLSYQWGGISSAILLWVIYLLLHHNPCCMPTGWEPWLLAAALGAAGGGILRLSDGEFT